MKRYKNHWHLRKESKRVLSLKGFCLAPYRYPVTVCPSLMLHERTIGGYARLRVVIRADRDLLAHLKPGDKVTLEMVEPKEAEQLWQKSSAL